MVEEIPPLCDKLRSVNTKMMSDFGQIVKIAAKFTLASLSPTTGKCVYLSVANSCLLVYALF